MARQSAAETRADIQEAMKIPAFPVGVKLKGKQLSKYINITNQRVNWAYSELELIVEYIYGLADIEKCRKFIAKNGFTDINDKGTYVEYPEVKILDRTIKRNQTILRQIGLTASDKRNENTKGKKIRQTIEDGDFKVIGNSIDDL